jgi:hypothetical protein
MVMPAPVVGERGWWKGAVGYAGRSAHQILHLDRGEWAISLQYDSSVAITVDGPGLRGRLPASLEPLGPYWYAGTARLTRPAWARLTVTSDQLPWTGRALGAFGLTRAPVPTGIRPLGRIVATRSPVHGRLMPLSGACGRYVDWYRLGPAGG